jgi:predicted secreted Zn-dependent protease
VISRFPAARPLFFALLLIGAPSLIYAQGYVAKGKNGELIYSNRPAEPVAASPVSLPDANSITATNYALTGASLEEVQKDAAQKGPVSSSVVGRVWSTTTWNATWNYWTRQEADICRIDVVSVRIKVASQLPAWSNEKDAPAPDQCRWGAFAKTLRRKEDARVSQVMARGRALEREILALPPRPRCETFAAEVAAMGQKLLDDGKPRALPPAQAAPPPRVALLAKPMAKSPPKPATAPPPPKPLAIPKAIYDACQG